MANLLAMIPVGHSELRKAYRQHSRCAQTGSEISHYLLLFYAVECGLKSEYLLTNHFTSIEKLSDERLRSSHDLGRWVKELRISAAAVGPTPSFRLRKGGTSWQIDSAHQSWRYNAAIKATDEANLVQWLKRVQCWINERI